MPKFATVLYFSIGLQQVSLEFRNTHLVGILRKFHLEFHQTWNKKNLWFARGHKIWCWSQKMGNTTVCKTHWLFVAISSWHIQLNIQRCNLIGCRPVEILHIENIDEKPKHGSFDGRAGGYGLLGPGFESPPWILWECVSKRIRIDGCVAARNSYEHRVEYLETLCSRVSRLGVLTAHR